MADLLAGIERLALVEALKGSFWIYPLINAAHIAAIGTLFATVMLMDLAVLGLFRRLAAAQAQRALRPVALAGFGIAVVTGGLLFSIRASEYAANPAFRIKLALIVLAAANFLMVRRAADPPAWAALSSLLLWGSVLVAGRFIGFV